MSSPTVGSLNPEIRRHAQKQIVRVALGILHEAWEEVLAKALAKASDAEDDITDVLRREMVLVKSKMRPTPKMRFEREAQSDAADDGTDLGLIDIMVCYSWNECTYFVIECKRISSPTNHLAKKYVNEGVVRFATGKYSNGHAFGAMIGYVICGNRERCIQRVRKVLARESTTNTGYNKAHGWKTDVDLVSGVEVATTRHHQRHAGNEIELVHSFVCFV